MSPEATRVAEWECQRILIRFFNALDERCYEELAGLMASDGIWTRQGVSLLGPEGVRAAMAERSKSVETRHLVSNLIVDVTSEKEARSAACVTVYHHDDEGRTNPAPLANPRSIFVFETTYVLSPEGWRIGTHNGRRVFAAAKERPAPGPVLRG